MKILLLMAALILALCAVPAATAGYPLGNVVLCVNGGTACVCELVDSAEGELTSPPSGHGGIPIAPIPHADLKGATWIIVCFG